MNQIRGQEFHAIIENIFGDVKGLNVSEQLQVNCIRCQERKGLAYPDGKFTNEIKTQGENYVWKCDELLFSGSLGKLIWTFGTSIDYDLYKSLAVSSQYKGYEDEK